MHNLIATLDCLAKHRYTGQLKLSHYISYVYMYVYIHVHVHMYMILECKYCVPYTNKVIAERLHYELTGNSTAFLLLCPIRSCVQVCSMYVHSLVVCFTCCVIVCVCCEWFREAGEKGSVTSGPVISGVLL